jgi:hypothetical protein
MVGKIVAEFDAPKVQRLDLLERKRRVSRSLATQISQVSARSARRLATQWLEQLGGSLRKVDSAAIR